MSNLLNISDSLTSTPKDNTWDWGVVSTTSPLSVLIKGTGVPVPVSQETEQVSLIEEEDKVVLFRAGQGGYCLFDKITDVINISTPDEPITSLQPRPGSPAPTLPGEPTVPGAEVVPVTPEGELPSFAKINAPTNIRVTDIVFANSAYQGTVRWDYTRSTEPDVPAETGFEITIRRPVTNELITREYATSAERNKIIGGWDGDSFYIAEVRAVTTASGAFTTYTEHQLRYILSVSGMSLPTLFSDWARSPRVQTPPDPVNPVISPTNVRWTGDRGISSLGVAWAYEDREGSPQATAFQVKACKNSLGTISCVTATAVARTERSRLLRTLDNNDRYWGFVRTVSGNRFSRWVAVGPPRRTLRDWRPTIRNLTLRRSGTSRNVVWSGEIRDATEIKASLRFQPFRIVNGVETEFEMPLRIEGTWQPLQGTPNREGFITIPPQLEGNLYVGRGTLTLILEARNSRASATDSVALTIRQLPFYIGGRLDHIGNRGLVALVNLLSLIPFIGGRLAGGIAASTRYLTTVSQIGLSRITTIYHLTRLAGRGVLGGLYAATRVGVPIAARAAYVTLSQGSGRTAAAILVRGGAPVAGWSLTGINLLFNVNYVGWNSIEWEIGARAAGNAPFSRDFFGTITNPGGGTAGASPVILNQSLNAWTITQNLQYFSPGVGVGIRLRTRATNDIGTTSWNSIILTPQDFALNTYAEGNNE